MDFAALKQEFSDRGFADLSETRRGQYVNRARAWLDDYALWGYREASVTGIPPVAIADLGVVEVVLNVADDTVLIPRTYLQLVTDFGDLAQASTPAFWYLATPGGTPEIATFPASSSATIGVQYWRVTADLSADLDEPAAPTRWHQLIVDLAVQFGYRDSDNHQAADALQVQVDRDLGLMTSALLFNQVQGASRFVRTSGRNY